MHLKASPQMVLGGNVLPSTFVKIDAVADQRVVQAGANDSIFGVSQVGVENLIGGVFGDSTYVGNVGEQVQLYTQGCYCLLKAGSGGWTRGNFLKSDANGAGVPVAATGDNYGARALASANAGEFGLVEVVVGATRNPVDALGTIAGNTTLTANDSGKTFVVTAADAVVTLPPTAAGLNYRFILAASGLSAGTGLSISPDPADKIMGNGFTSADNKDAILAGSGDREGDTIEVKGDGNLGWYITDVIGTWTREA